MLTAAAQPLLSDEVLADRARGGACTAFEILVSRYQGRVYRLAMRMSRNASDAEEITQETFLHAHRGMTSFQGKSRFGTWLYRIAVNEALMCKRAAGRRPACSLDGLESVDTLIPQESGANRASQAGTLQDDLLERKRAAERVRDALNQLDNDSRAALVVRDLGELSADEAAAILGISPEALRQRVHRARVRLRDLLYSVSGGSSKSEAGRRLRPKRTHSRTPMRGSFVELPLRADRTGRSGRDRAVDPRDLFEIGRDRADHQR